MSEDIKVPEIGENVESGEVVGVPVKEGDMVEVDDVIIELETDKATIEIPSPVNGRIEEVLVGEGDTVKVGDVIARVDTDADSAGEEEEKEKSSGESSEEAPAEKEKAAAEEEKEPETEEAKKEGSREDSPSEARREKGDSGEREHDEPPAEGAAAADEDIGSFEGVAAAPSVRRLARELGVDLRKVPGSAPGGRISESDVKAFVKKGGSVDDRQGGVPATEPAKLPDFSQWGEIESVDLTKVRRLTAESTSTSWRQIPHVTQFDQADITALQAFIGKNAQKVRQAGGKLTVTAVLAKVCCEGLKTFPHFNASIDLENRKLILKKYIHLGVMVATSRGLLVPVIRNADRLSITELSTAIFDLADRARSKKIKPDELQGGTFSISNQGGIGGTAFTPVVLWPQAAILGVSRSSRVPVYRDGDLEAREILPLSLSYDHRIVDGADAARFLRWICDSLEQAFNLFLE
jgi:pyruvate dehydrogenase E2 component (dihydrolipoamide acetyltransferase)